MLKSIIDKPICNHIPTYFPHLQTIQHLELIFMPFNHTVTEYNIQHFIKHILAKITNLRTLTLTFRGLFITRPSGWRYCCEPGVNQDEKWADAHLLSALSALEKIPRCYVVQPWRVYSARCRSYVEEERRRESPRLRKWEVEYGLWEQSVGFLEAVAKFNMSRGQSVLEVLDHSSFELEGTWFARF
ncbi:hypothetical protein EJ08DRAFT_654353 [Tothia fuscella]|uniref:Uncharacterized protein n=1 Tax=Tothia fuscella TaxID=1048955 RepID=A0A9P4NEY2_9PEZI|nr:hypothetical protein EJ08DRAFT_654353 [Tothia fuscella]